MAESKASAENHSYSKCKGCNEEIRDKYLLQALDKLWHVYCLRCCDCREALDQGKCYFRDENVLCEIDYFRRYGKPCSICQEGISPKHSVRKVLDKVYHISCFSCAMCKKQLSTGDLFYLLDDGGVICKQDLEESKYSGEFYPSSPNAGTPISSKDKRVRTFITAQQLSVLKSVYHSSPWPDFAERLRISKVTGLDMRVVQVWFQNRRAKERRQSEKVKNPWINMLPKTTTRRRSLDQLTPTVAPGAPFQNGHMSDMIYSEDHGPSYSANSSINVAQQMEVFNHPPIPASNVVIPPLSPAVHDVVSSPRFVFPHERPSSFPPVQDLLAICEEELQSLMNQDPTCTTQQSPTHSYYADSESERSDINTPVDKRYFVFPDVPATPDHWRYPPHSGAFSFDPEIIDGATHGATF